MKLTDRNCHFGVFAVLRRNLAFTSNYDDSPNPNNRTKQKFSATPTPRSIRTVYFCRQAQIRANVTKLKHITPPRSLINSDFEVLSCSA